MDSSAFATVARARLIFSRWERAEEVNAALFANCCDDRGVSLEPPIGPEVAPGDSKARSTSGLLPFLLGVKSELRPLMCRLREAVAL